MSALNVLEKVNKHLANVVKHFEVVVFELHFHVEASELAQVAVSVRVFGAEDRANFEDAREATAKRHLLIELGRLGQTAVLVEILELENISTAFRATANKLG